MNREIKFRAWDKHEKRWLGDSEFSSICIGLDGNVSKFSFAFETFESMDAVDLVRYTGLKDKNGVEIYEGDILGHGDAVDFVVFDEGAFFMSGSGDSVFDWVSDKRDVTEVAGNIYENPGMVNRPRVTLAKAQHIARIVLAEGSDDD